MNLKFDPFNLVGYITGLAPFFDHVELVFSSSAMDIKFIKLNEEDDNVRTITRSMLLDDMLKSKDIADDIDEIIGGVTALVEPLKDE